MNVKKLYNIYQSTLEEGGYTNPELTGYSVALPSYEMKLSIDDFSVQILEAYYTKMIGLGFEVGTWFNREEKYVYLDAITVVADKNHAIKLGEKYKQLAIYDIAEKKEIFLS